VRAICTGRQATETVGSDPTADLSAPLQQWRRWTDGPLLVVGIGSVPLLLLEVIRNELTHADRVFLWVVNIIVATVFTVDYVVEFRLAPDKASFVRSEKIGAAIVISSLIALVPAIAVVGGTRLIRLAPTLRALAILLRLFGSGGLAAREGRRLVRRNTLRVALGVTGMVWVSSAVAFTMAEEVDSFFDSLWWAAATITTVGYGDFSPVTVTGRIAGLFAMVVGITAFGLLTAQFAAFLSRNDD